MDPGERATGTRDEHYDLVSVLYHALQGADNCGLYLMDADAAGRDDQVAFFREAQAMQMGLAERAKGLLGIISGADAGRASLSEGPGEGVAPPGEVPPDAPRTGEAPPRTGDAPPSPSEPPPSG